ncbi:MAG: S41 family peptidase [Tissierellia bacterium]|nr:S41 family peptidase [Tissierellia bacterium]
MKKVFKVVLAFVIIIAVGFTGFTLGSNSSQQISQEISRNDQEYIDNINYLKEIINQNYLFDYDEKDLEVGSYKGLFEGLNDQYSVYYTKEEFDKLLEDTSGEYAGIGVVISPSEAGLIKIVDVFKDSPADKAGLKVDDYIIKVKDKEYSDTDIDKAVSQMKGKEGTSVDITILRLSEDGKEEKEINKTIERENIIKPTVQSQVVDGENVGYIRISEFDEVTTEDFKKALSDLESKNVDGIVLDLRNNPGGLLDTALDIADIFLDEGVIVSTKDKDGKEVVEKSDSEKDDIKLTVLINENSASASEILSGALKDRQRAKVVGTTSFGKGIVQKVFPISTDGAGVKITVSEYFTPSGEKIHQIGVKPDEQVKSDISAGEIGIDNYSKDNQLQKAVELLKK